MGKASGIGWTDSTFNQWWGCVEVSPACDNCYARTWDARFAGDNAHWGKDAPRKFFSDKHNDEPLRWNAASQAKGNPPAGPGVPRDKRWLVFCSSMSDVFERRDDLVSHRMKLWSKIAQTPYLTWLLLTKRPQNIASLLPSELRGADNVWLGTTVESPEYLWRVDALCENDMAAVRFLSMEPLLARIDTIARPRPTYGAGGAQIDWVIAGCESGENRRDTPTEWFRALRDVCVGGEIPYFLKQARRGAEGITGGERATLKLKNGIIEAPYLDGVQWVQFP